MNSHFALASPIHSNNYDFDNGFPHQQEGYSPKIKIFYSDQEEEPKFVQQPKVQTFPSQLSTLSINKKIKKNRYKNLPDLISGHFVHCYVDNFDYEDEEPNWTKTFILTKQHSKQTQNSQKKTSIKELKNLCSEPETQGLFQTFMKEEFILSLLHSNKVADPLDYAEGISSYYAASFNPEKMRGNYLIKKE